MAENNGNYGYTKVLNVIFDNILPSLTPAAQLVYLRIYRRTLGWRKEYGSTERKRKDKITHTQLAKDTGYKRHEPIVAAIGSLVENKLIHEEGEPHKVKTYSIDLSTLWELQECDKPFQEWKKEILEIPSKN